MNSYFAQPATFQRSLVNMRKVDRLSYKNAHWIPVCRGDEGWHIKREDDSHEVVVGHQELYNEKPLVSMFQNIAEKNMPFGPGMTFINPVEHRYVYCVNSAHTDFGIHKKRIKTLLASHGLTNRINLHDSAIYFDAERARPIFESALETITSKEAAQVLGISEEKLRLLVKSGLLPQVEGREERRNYIRIQRLDLNDLQARLVSHAERMEESDEAWISPQDFAQGYSFPLNDILKLLLDATVASRVIAGNEGLVERLRINKDEVRLIALQQHVDSDEKFITFQDALGLLGTSDPTLIELIKQGYITETKYERSAKRARLISENSIMDFKTRFISLVDFCDEIGANRAGMKKRLADLNVKPLFDKSNRVASYYSRIDISKIQTAMIQS